MLFPKKQIEKAHTTLTRAGIVDNNVKVETNVDLVVAAAESIARDEAIALHHASQTSTQAIESYNNIVEIRHQVYEVQQKLDKVSVGHDSRIEDR